jgi:hypothetical protein
MTTTIGGQQLATTSSSHQAVWPPTPSNIPPMAPPTPTGVPAPFPHKGNTGTAASTCSKLTAGGGETVTEGSEFDIDPPANNPSNPAPIHDLTTGVINKKASVA